MINPNRSSANNFEKGLIIAGVGVVSWAICSEVVHGANADYSAAQANIRFDENTLGTSKIKLNQDIAEHFSKEHIASDKALVAQGRNNLTIQLEQPLDHYTGATQTGVEWGIPAVLMLGSLAVAIGQAIKHRRASI